MLAKLSLLVVLVLNVVLCSQFQTKKLDHDLHKFSSRSVKYLASLSDVHHLNTLLDNILVPRVVDTPSHTRVFNYIRDELEDNGFTVEIDRFKETTPTHGALTFKNIVGVLNPSAERYLVLACHYDSKYFEKEVFIGATDSGVPCAMMLNLIKTLKHQLTAVKHNDVSLMLLFLDGEEAFLEWSKTDSIYGARNLAKKWDGTISRSVNGENVSMLDRMDAFVLLDLLGTPNPVFYSYFWNTERLYLALSRAEDDLSRFGMLQHHKKKYFREAKRRSFIEDDHLPFMNAGVPILHIIPTPFPDVWHTTADDRTAIDMPTIENLNKILRVFVAEYLHVPIIDNSDDEDYADGDRSDTRPGGHEEF